MSRDDSVLYTGQTSVSFGTPKAEEIKAKQALAKQERLDKQHKLKPAAEVVLALIKNHRDKATHVLAVATSDAMTDQEAGELLRSQRKIYAFLNQFEQEIRIALREVPHD